MTPDFRIRINRRDGALEIAGPERDWVDAKLAELSDIYMQPLSNVTEGRESSWSEVPTKPNARPGTGRQLTGTNKRNTSGAPSKPTSARRSAGRPQRNPDLETKLTREVVQKFTDYIDERKAGWEKKQTHQAAIIATFLEDELRWSGVDEDDLYTVYRALSLDGPSNFRSMLQNAYGRDKFFTGMNDGKYTLSLVGEKFGRVASLNG